MIVAWGTALAASRGGDVGKASSGDLAARWLDDGCEGEASLGPGWRLSDLELWPDAACDRVSTPVVVRGGAATPAEATVPEHARWAVDWEAGSRRYAATATTAAAGLVHGAQFPGPGVGGVEVEGASAWVVGRSGLWAVASDTLAVRYRGSPNLTMCHVRPDELMLAGACMQVPVFGTTSWTVEIAPAEGWAVSGAGEDLHVALPTVFAVRGATLAGQVDGVRIYETPEAPQPDPQALAARLARNHAGLVAAFGPLDPTWTVLPVHFAHGWAASSGYPSIGVGFHFASDGEALAHEVAHAWFGGRVVPSFDRPGGHWHEALATWALADVDPGAAKGILSAFVNQFRDATVRRGSVALTRTTYWEASDGEKYGKGLAAMLTLDATYGRENVVRAMRRWLDDNAGRQGSWNDVVVAVEEEIGPEAATRLRSWLDDRWVPTLFLRDGVLWLDDPVDPDHALTATVMVTNERYEIVAELPVSFGSGLVEVGPLPDDGAYAFPQGELPVEGPNIYLRRDRP